MENVKKFDEILKAIRPAEVKEKAKKFDFFISDFKSPGQNLFIEIKMPKDRFSDILDKNIDERKIKKIEENLRGYFLNLTKDKQEDLLRLPNTYDYFVNSVSGTAVVTPFVKEEFLEKGGMVIPDVKNFSRHIPSVEVKKEQKASVFISIRGDGNNVSLNNDPPKPPKNWFSMSNPFVWIIFVLIAFLIKEWIGQ